MDLNLNFQICILFLLLLLKIFNLMNAQTVDAFACLVLYVEFLHRFSKYGKRKTNLGLDRMSVQLNEAFLVLKSFKFNSQTYSSK